MDTNVLDPPKNELSSPEQKKNTLIYTRDHWSDILPSYLYGFMRITSYGTIAYTLNSKHEGATVRNILKSSS